MADYGRIQLDGAIKLGNAPGTLVDYSNYISTLVLHLTRDQVDIPATYGNPRARKRLGARNDTIEIVYFADESDAAGVWAEIMDRFLQSAPLVYFSAQYKTGSLSVTNTGWTGSFVPGQIDAGTEVGVWKSQSQTFPLDDVQGPLTA